LETFKPLFPDQTMNSRPIHQSGLEELQVAIEKHKWRLIVKFVENNIKGTAELRKEVQSVIDKANDQLLEKVLALAKNHDEEEDYTLPGPPMDVETYRARILKASDRAKTGNYTTSEDLEKEMEQW